MTPSIGGVPDLSAIVRRGETKAEGRGGCDLR